jgi:hypothetical protein
MASTYTDAGIELIAVGEQSNTWGQTTNTNWRLMEEMATGVVQISLNGLSSYSLTTTDGVTSNGRHLVIEFTGAPGATCTVSVVPDDMQKLYFINNATDQSVVITQGSGGDVTVPAGTKKIVYCDGAGGGAAVADLTENLAVGSLILNGVTVTASASEINILDGVTATTEEINILDGVTATTNEINILDGVTASTAELNILDGVTASTEEINILDGITATTSELNTLDGVTASATEINYLDGAIPGTLVEDKAVVASDTGVIALGSTWSVREDSGTLYFNSASGDVLTVDSDGTLTTSGEIVVE